MFLRCVRDVWRQGQAAILTQLLLLTIARCVIFNNPLSTSSVSWLGLLNRGSLRATALRKRSQSVSWFSHWPSCDQLTEGPPASAYILHNAHLLSLLLPLIYTCASLIDGSVKGQYITYADIQNWNLAIRYSLASYSGHARIHTFTLIWKTILY